MLAHLSEGDPLKLCEACARRLRERWVLLDSDRLQHRALAACAFAACREAVPQDLVSWALDKIDKSIEQLLRADREAEQDRPDHLTDEEANFPLLTECLMLEPELVRAASVAFNKLDELPRRAFFELLIEGREVEEVLERGPCDENGLYEAVQAALKALGLDAEGQPSDDRPPRERK